MYNISAAKRLLINEALDPVGREDADIDNDGRKNTKRDKYLLNRRRVRSLNIEKQRVAKEEYSNWREDLCEILHLVEKDKNEQKIQEKKNIKNKVKINPGVSESVENLGGTLIEMIEIDEFDYLIESVYDELLDEGYDEDEIEEAIEYALSEKVKITQGRGGDPTLGQKKSLLGAARVRLSGIKKSASGAIARGARGLAKGALGVARKLEGDNKPSPVHSKSGVRRGSTYSGAGVGRQERVSSGSYQAPRSAQAPRATSAPKPQPKSEPVSDPWEGSYATTKKTQPVAKTSKATAKPLTKDQEKAIKRATRRNPNLSKQDAERIAASIPSRETRATELKKRMAAAAAKRGLDEANELLEKAESKQQQKIFGLALSVKRGETSRSKVSPQVLKMVDGMSEKQIRDFAKTSHKGLPRKVSVKEDYLDEKARGTRPKRTVHAYDVDETLFGHGKKGKPNVKVHVKDSSGKRVKSLSNQEFNTHKLEPGHSYDFSEFRSAKKFGQTASPNKKVIKDLKRRQARGQNVHIITARDKFDKPKEFHGHLEKHGIKVPMGNIHYTGGMRGGDIGKKKVDVATAVAKQHKTSNIHMHDDAPKVLKAFEKEKGPGKKIKTHLIKPDSKGEARSRSFQATKEAVDMTMPQMGATQPPLKPDTKSQQRNTALTTLAKLRQKQAQDAARTAAQERRAAQLGAQVTG